MNKETFYGSAKPRHRVWCLSSDLIAGQDGSYTFETPQDIGDGSEIIVMDQPGFLLFWDATNEKAYPWG